MKRRRRKKSKNTITDIKSTVKYGTKTLDLINSNDSFVPTSAIAVKLTAQEKNILAIAIKDDLPTLLIGETGTGKTSIIKEIAFLRKQPYIRVNMTGFTTPDELIGSKSVKNGATYFENGIITNAMLTGAILVLDEINATTPDCLFILHGLLDDDKRITLPNGDIITPHKDFRVFATCNPDYEGTKSMNKAFLDRFPVIISIDTLSPSQEIELLEKRTKINKILATQLVTIATMARKDYIENKITTYISTRTLLNMANLINNGLEPIDAFTTTVMQKTTIKEEQKVLKDFFLSVFKMADTENNNLPVILTSQQYKDLTIKEEQLEKQKSEYLQAQDIIRKLQATLIENNTEKENLTTKLKELENQKMELSKDLEGYKNLQSIFKEVMEKNKT